MANTWTEALSRTKVVIFDYPALFEAGRYTVFKNLLETILSSKIDVLVNTSFHVYNACVTHADNPNDEEVKSEADEFLSMLLHAGRLVVESSEMSVISLVKDNLDQNNVCLITGKRSSLITQIREEALSGNMMACVFDGGEYKLYKDLKEMREGEVFPDVNPVSSSTDYLDVAIYVNVGDTVCTREGERILLTEKISTGAEGLVFRTDDPKRVAKIYHRGVMTPLRWMKLIRMTQMKINSDGICWPRSLIYNQNNEPVGFVMPAAEGYTLGAVFDGQDAIYERFPEWDRRSVVETACKVFEKIVYLHLFGIMIGDIQLKNIMILCPSKVYLIDMDSVQIEDLPCPVGTEEFTPPELWDRSFQSFLRNSIHEDYSCGILAFAILLCGQHPYNQRQGHETLREEIATKSFPYSTDGKENDQVPVGGFDRIWQALPVQLRNMFFSAFSGGRRYETIEWYAALVSYNNELSLKKFPDPESYMLFPYNPHKVKAEEVNYSRKRTIRDSIIHVPEADDPTSSTRKYPDKVMYNGRPIGVAFVNQDKLAEIELKRAGVIGPVENTANKPAGSQDAKCGSDRPAAGDKKAAAEKTASKSNGKNQKGKNKSKTFFFLLLFLFVIILAILYTLTK